MQDYLMSIRLSDYKVGLVLQQLYTMITKESELHHSIGSPIDGAHPGPKTDRNYLGRYCP